MACKCSPSLKRLMADFAALGHVNSGCCGDAAHQARVSDHNPDSSGYAHAQDVHEKLDHDMQPYVDFVMAHPGLFPQVKYMIYEGHIYYPHDGARKAGKYTYTGPNAHAGHMHMSIFASATDYTGDWYVAAVYGGSSPTVPPSDLEENDVRYCYTFDRKYWITDLIFTRWVTGSVDFGYLLGTDTPNGKARAEDLGAVHGDFHHSLIDVTPKA